MYLFYSKPHFNSMRDLRHNRGCLTYKPFAFISFGVGVCELSQCENSMSSHYIVFFIHQASNLH